ncbi:unnamed protein product [Caenorhabditis brenneri]
MAPICDKAASTSPMVCHMDPITIVAESLTAPSKDTTSNLISPAKEDQIKAARIRMEVYLAKKGGSMKKPIVVSASNHIHRTDPAKLDKPTSGSGFSVTLQTELLAAVADNSEIPNREPSSSQFMSLLISPAKAGKIEAAKIRMEAYLAKKSGSTKENTSAGNARSKCNSQTKESTKDKAENVAKIDAPVPSATSTSDHNFVEIVPKSPVKRTKWVASLSEGTSMSSNPQKPDVKLGDTLRLTSFVVRKLSEEQKSQPQYAAYWSKQKLFYSR